MKIKVNTIALFRELAKLVAPPPLLTVSEWADKERRLSPEASAEPGQWSTDRTPYMREVMDALADPTIERIVMMTSSQVGKTEFILNVIGYTIDRDPVPLMVIQPTLDMAKTFSKDRLAPMLRDTPCLKGKVQDVRSRDSGNTMLHKTFPGGHITIVGANSAASLASRPIARVLADEIDRYPPSAGTEGDPLTLAGKRMTTFWNRKEIDVSTPTVKGESRIEALYELGTMEQWHLPCPSCGEYQPLTWGQIRFEDVTHECRRCKERHDEFAWKAGRGKWVARKDSGKVRSFHLNELVSPWKRWATIIDEFREAKAGGKEALKAWVNTSLGETWEEQGDTLDAELFNKRRQTYNCQVPDGVLVLTAAVDVQDDRLETEIVGWGLGKESWGIAYRVFAGDPAQTVSTDPSRPTVWEQLDEYLQQVWEYEDGTGIGVSCTCIDSGGHFTSEVYEFTKAREHRRIFAIKGVGGAGVPFIGRPSRNNRKKAVLFPLGVDTGKETLFSRLKTEFEGPGYCHYPREADRGYDEGYFRGLTAEKKVIRYYKGKPRIEWSKRSGARNEPLDLRVYATAALEILNPNMDALAAMPRNGQKKTVNLVSRPRKRRVYSSGVSV